MCTKWNTTMKMAAVITFSLFVLSGCGTHRMDSMDGENSKKEAMSKPMDGSMMEMPEKKMESDNMMDGMDGMDSKQSESSMGGGAS